MNTESRMPTPPLAILSASHQNLWRLTLIRILVLLAQAASVGFAYFSDLLPSPLPWTALWLTLAASATLCALTAFRLRFSLPVSEREYAAQLACDLLIHSLLLYYSGGSANPFVSYYLVPLTIAAATLSRFYSLLLAGLALAAYNLLIVWSQPLEMLPGQREKLLIYGMWLSFALAAVLITFFVAAMAAALRRQEELRAKRREEGLRDQQLLAIATQAAGAAHELGTPLATMSVLLKELRHEYPEKALQEDLAMLQEQVSQCKSTLQQLVRAAEIDRREALPEQTASDWLDSALNRWNLMRPEVSYQYQCLGQGEPPRLSVPTDLNQALLNLLNNAADACPQQLAISLNWDNSHIHLCIHDQGSGVSPAIAKQIGQPFVSSKGSKGFGIGLFLSQASIRRAGGSLRLYPHAVAGTVTELKLPHRSQGNTL